ncbi:hypothetical protein [Chondromyces apiculatus]|uniref:Uncharacterized protein n=1 Tax=Chondromyces apiculatus DSM 436 TaxID=1192034 RepID=A0A017TJ53_9BACT|nr:hypothetical protein [Chondromyces apiculatus]EYF08636.1 Hypothetical protein CAP_2496 [Chondromyces apiculatus DSM 436]
MKGTLTHTTARHLAALLVACTAGCTYEVADYPSQAILYDQPEPEISANHRNYDGFVLAIPGGGAFTAQVNDGGILGRDQVLGNQVNVGRYTDGDDRALRGEAFGQWLDLKVEKGRVHGILDGMIPLDVRATREDGALRIRGVVRGYQADFRVADDRLVGTLGRCSYDLTSHGSPSYEGLASCPGGRQKVMVKIPGELSRWSDAEQGAALGLLLGGS